MKTTLPPEERLVRALQDHHRTDFAQLYAAYAPALFGLLVRLVRDRDRAEDLLQEAFIKIWLNSQRYNPQQGRPYTWMATIARNLALDELRARKRHFMRPAYPLTGADASSPAQVMEEMVVGTLLEQLAPKYRVVVDLMYYQTYTAQEAADTLHLPLGTVKTRVRVGLEQLKAIFRQDIYHYRQGTPS